MKSNIVPIIPVVPDCLYLNEEYNDKNQVTIVEILSANRLFILD